MGTHPIFESDFDCLTENRRKKMVRPPKKKPQKRALNEIRRLQRSTDLLIRKAPFMRLVKEITVNTIGGDQYRWQALAVEALQNAAEVYMTSLFEQSNLMALHAKRVTVMPKDVNLVLRIQQMNVN